MTDTDEIIHQIEYRWHHTRDLSPIASTMSPESLRGWDAWIRGWVRHPHATDLTASMRFQSLPSGRAALAWRYRDEEMAERAGGLGGRPLVSRVIVGHASRLTPDVAIVACRTGFPAVAGAAPGKVTAETVLPVISARELHAAAVEHAQSLDEEAARQQGLHEVIAAALAAPQTPLAIHLRDTYIHQPPGKGPQCALLWGLRRVMWPLLGPAGRGWSFSTFEPPLGDVDPATLPDIVFRQVLDAPAAPPSRPRAEIRVRPFDPRALDASGPLAAWAALAGWLVDEYARRGGDELREFIVKWCGADQSAQARLEKIHEQFRGMRASALPLTDAPVRPPDAPAPQADALPAPAEALPALTDALADAGLPVGQQAKEAPLTEAAGQEWQKAPSPHSVEAIERDPAARAGQSGTSARQPATMSNLLVRLELASDVGEFEYLLRDIRASDRHPDEDDRARSRRVLSNDYWYDNVSGKFDDAFAIAELAEIFQAVVIPDLAEPEVIMMIARWSADAPPSVIAGLLGAAKESGVAEWQAMMRILQPVLALRWLADMRAASLWDADLAARPSGDNSRGRRAFWHR